MKIIIAVLLTSLMTSTASAAEYYFKPGDSQCTAYDLENTPALGPRIIFYPTIEECETTRANTPVPPVRQVKKLPNLGPGNWTPIGKITNRLGGQHIVIVKPPLKEDNNRFVIWIAANTLVAVPPKEEALAIADDLDQWDKTYPGARFMAMLYFIDCENVYMSMMVSVTPYTSENNYKILVSHAEKLTQQIITSPVKMEDVEQKLLREGALSHIERSTIPGLLADFICK